MSKIFLIPVLVLLTSCSASWHLKQAIKKGALITHDTIYQNIVVPGSVTHDTLIIERKVFLDKIFRDTLIINSEKWRTKTIYDSITKTVFQEVEIKKDSIKTAVAINTNIKEPVTKMKWYQEIFLCVIIVLVLWLLIEMVRK